MLQLCPAWSHSLSSCNTSWSCSPAGKFPEFYQAHSQPNPGSCVCRWVLQPSPAWPTYSPSSHSLAQPGMGHTPCPGSLVCERVPSPGPTRSSLDPAHTKTDACCRLAWPGLSRASALVLHRGSGSTAKLAPSLRFHACQQVAAALLGMVCTQFWSLHVPVSATAWPHPASLQPWLP